MSLTNWYLARNFFTFDVRVCACVCVCVCNRERQRETEERMSDLNINKRDGIDGHNVNYFGDTR